MFRSLLREQVSIINFVSYLSACFFSISLFVYLNSAQAFLLPFILTDTSSIGQVTAQLTLYDELLSLPTCFFAGILSDRFGRHPVYAFGFFAMGAALILYPLAQFVYPQLLLARLLFSLGASCAAAMLTAVLADIANESGRGKISAMVGTMSGLGAILALFVWLRIPADLSRRFQYSKLEATRIVFIGIGIASILYACVLFFGLRFKNNKQLNSGSVNSTGYTNIFKQYANSIFATGLSGITAAKDPCIAMGYFGSFVARSSSVLVTLFIPLYVNSYYSTHNLCPRNPLDASNKLSLAETRAPCHDAYIRASIISGVTQTFALVGASFFGLLIDQMKRQAEQRGEASYYLMIPSLSSSLFGAAGFLGFVWVNKPVGEGSGWMYPSVIAIGLGEIGMIVCSMALVTRNSHGMIPREQTQDQGTPSITISNTFFLKEGDSVTARQTYESIGQTNQPQSVHPTIPAFSGGPGMHCPHSSASLPIQISSGSSPSNSVISDSPNDDVQPIHHNKGSIAGTYSFFGALGIIICSQAGGVLFDDWNAVGPFFLLLLLNILYSVVGILLWLFTFFSSKRAVRIDLT